MALIHCKNCGAEISERALQCPSCGALTGMEKEEESSAENGESTKEMTICEECGHEFSKMLAECPKCGCPVSNDDNLAECLKSVSGKTSKRKGRKWIAVFLTAVLITVCGVAAHNANQKNTYFNNMVYAVDAMLSGAVEAENAGGLIHDVWYNAIFDKNNDETYEYTATAEDFNEALDNLFEDKDFQKKISGIIENQTEVAGYIVKLQNPPDEFAETSGEIKELYDYYLDITNAVIMPVGSLNSYTEDFNETDSSFATQYGKVVNYLSGLS